MIVVPRKKRLLVETVEKDVNPTQIASVLKRAVCVMANVGKAASTQVSWDRKPIHLVRDELPHIFVAKSLLARKNNMVPSKQK